MNYVSYIEKRVGEIEEAYGKIKSEEAREKAFALVQSFYLNHVNVMLSKPSEAGEKHLGVMARLVEQKSAEAKETPSVSVPEPKLMTQSTQPVAAPYMVPQPELSEAEKEVLGRIFNKVTKEHWERFVERETTPAFVDEGEPGPGVVEKPAHWMRDVLAAIDMEGDTGPVEFDGVLEGSNAPVSVVNPPKTEVGSFPYPEESDVLIYGWANNPRLMLGELPNGKKVSVWRAPRQYRLPQKFKCKLDQRGGSPIYMIL